MTKKLFVLCEFLLVPALLIVVVNFSLNTNKVVAQENKEDKCEELAKCFQQFHRECLNENFLNSFSPKDIDKFAIVNYEDEMSHLYNFYVELNNNPDAVGFIVVYGGRVNKFGEFDERVKRVKNYLLNDRKLNPSRIKIVHGGFREKFEFELWISPIKNSFPPLSPTVNPEQVKFKGRMKPLDSEL